MAVIIYSQVNTFFIQPSMLLYIVPPSRCRVILFTFKRSNFVYTDRGGASLSRTRITYRYRREETIRFASTSVSTQPLTRAHHNFLLSGCRRAVEMKFGGLRKRTAVLRRWILLSSASLLSITFVLYCWRVPGKLDINRLSRQVI